MTSRQQVRARGRRADIILHCNVLTPDALGGCSVSFRRVTPLPVLTTCTPSLRQQRNTSKEVLMIEQSVGPSNTPVQNVTEFCSLRRRTVQEMRVIFRFCGL